jgi:hypothetical protein
MFYGPCGSIVEANSSPDQHFDNGGPIKLQQSDHRIPALKTGTVAIYGMLSIRGTLFNHQWMMS